MKRMFSLLALLILFCAFFFSVPIMASRPNEHDRFLDDPVIVFVHIGTREREFSYLPVAIKQAHLFNPRIPIILLANESTLHRFSTEGTLPDDTIMISCESVPKTEEHLRFIKEWRHSGGLFWLYTSERFLYLHDLIAYLHLNDVFHLENDVMLYAELENLLPIFHDCYSGIAATFDNDQRCIPGFVYIPSAQNSQSLASCFCRLACHGLNDMQIFAHFKLENSKKEIDHLPIIMPEYAQKHELISPSGHTVRHADSYYQNIHAFASIFDAAALGQYLGGIDNGGVPGFINESCIFNPSLLNYEWQFDFSGRRVPYAIYEGVKYRINNLHIHSKQLKQFAS